VFLTGGVGEGCCCDTRGKASRASAERINMDRVTGHLLETRST
jgi:hypothetical protein